MTATNTKITTEMRDTAMKDILIKGKLIADVDKVVELNTPLVEARARVNFRYRTHSYHCHSDFVQTGLLAVVESTEKFEYDHALSIDDNYNIWKTFVYKKVNNRIRNINRLTIHEVRHGITTSVEDATTDDGKTKLIDVIQARPEANNIVDELSNLRKILPQVLNEKELRVVTMKHDLEDTGIKFNSRSMAAEIGCSAPTIRWILERAYIKIKNELETV